MRRPRFPLQVAALAIALAIFPSLPARPALAAPPVISTLDVRGLQIGSVTKITLTGSGLLADPQLVMSIPIAEQTLADGAADNRATFEVKLDNRVEPGIYNLWVRSAEGFSAPVQMAVDHLPNQPSAEEVAQLPVAISGVVAGSGLLRTSFPGKAGEELILEAEALRLGGKLRPVIHVYDANRLQLAWAMPRLSLAGDARLNFRVPADGTYTVEVHDAEYAAQNPNFVRLKIGVWQYADMVFPPAVNAGSATAVQLIGNMADDTAVQLPSTRYGESLAAPWPDSKSASGPRPRVLVSSIPELLEQPSAKEPQQLPDLPCAVSGRLAVAGEEDLYRLTVAPETKLRLEIFADRLGAAVDAVLEVRNEKGARLGTNDDVAGTADPLLDFTVPKDVETLLIAVRDAVGGGGPRSIYRLAVTPLQPQQPAADYQLTLPSSPLNVPMEGTLVVPVLAERAGYEGPIQLKFDALPAGVVASGGNIPPQAGGTLLTLSGKGTAAGGAVASLHGAAAAGGRVVAVEEHPLGEQQPWLKEELAVALTTAAEQKLTAAIGKLPAGAGLVKGAKLTLPLTLKRPEGDFGPVRVTLLTSQNVPIVNNRRNANQAIRLEKATEIAPAAESGDLVLIIPPDLPETPYELALRAELLSKDKRQVLADVYTPVMPLPTINPIVLKLDGQPKLDVQLDAKAGATVEVVGKIQRQGAVTGDVTVTLEGMPNGIAVAKPVIKADQDEFRVEVKFPANAAVGELADIKLFGTILPDPKNTRNIVRSQDLLLTFRVLAAAPPEKK